MPNVVAYFKMKQTALILFLIISNLSFAQKDSLYVIDKDESIRKFYSIADSVYQLKIWYCKSISKGIQKYKNLEAIEFENSNFEFIPDFLIENEKLLRFSITNHKNDGNVARQIFKDICKFKNIKKLEIYGLRTKIPDEIENLEGLEELEIHFCEINSIPVSLFNLKKLRTLKINCNNISEIPREISNLDNLKELDISHNRFTEFPKEVLSLNKLLKLGFRGMQLPLPIDIIKLSKLEELDIRMNNYTDLANEIKSIETLKVLDIRDNNFSDAVKDSIKNMYLSNDSINIIIEDPPYFPPTTMKVGDKIFQIGDTIGFFERFDFESGNWIMVLSSEYAYFSSKENKKQYNEEYYLDLTYGLYKKNMNTFFAILEDSNLIKNIQHEMKVTLTGGDMATAYLQLYLICNDTIIYTTGLFADKTEGFQGWLGWTPCVKKGELIEFLELFKSIEPRKLKKYGIIIK